MNSKLCLSQAIMLAMSLATCSAASAQGFAAAISPSRFELHAKPGETVRESLTVLNPSTTPADYLFKTVDWALDDSSGIQYLEESLLDGSCRPWVTLERKTVTIRNGASRGYRFEVQVPEDAAPGLCRFAILIEPAEAYTAHIGEGDLALPVVGRYAVITYVTIGDAAAAIDYLGLSKADNNGLLLPAITVRNTGTTHDRAFGQITAVDGAGTRVSLIPSSFPVLPGRTETLALAPESDPQGRSPITLEHQFMYPVKLRGSIEIAGQSIEIDATLE
jgi:hypothetical protein